MNENAALYYMPDGYETSGERLMGRQAAGEAFLRGFTDFSDVDRLVCCSHDTNCYEGFRQHIASFLSDDPGAVLNHSRPMECISIGDHRSLSRVGCLHYPSPTLAEFAWARRGYRSDGYSLCGITHTTASSAIMDALAALLTAPIEPWDALICTSEAVRKMVESYWNGYASDLLLRLGCSVSFRGQLPVIPLGVDCRNFARNKAAYEQGLVPTGVHMLDELIASRSADEVRILFVGRLSFHAKAHPLPVYLALEEVARRSNKKIHLIQAGWFANDSIHKAFVDGAKHFCPSVRVTFLDGRLKPVRDFIWYASDIFCSLADNIQETFGITPLEAMAAGLPVVVTDWNGYRETVRDGIDGFRIPTAQPPPGCAEHIAQAYANGTLSYDRYIGYVSQSVAVDVDTLTKKLMVLVESPDLRRQMGQAGAQQMSRHFDWSHIVRRYQELWHELRLIRQAVKRMQRPVAGAPLGKATSVAKNPARPDPFALFAHYPTLTVTADTTLSFRKGIDQHEWRNRCSHPLHSFARPVMCDDRTIEQMLEKLSKDKALSIHELVQGFQQIHPNRIIGTITWLMKMGVISFPERRAVGSE